MAKHLNYKCQTRYDAMRRLLELTGALVVREPEGPLIDVSVVTCVREF